MRRLSTVIQRFGTIESSGTTLTTVVRAARR
jgi:hypothetical protein